MKTKYEIYLEDENEFDRFANEALDRIKQARDDKGRYDSKSEFMRWLKAQFPAYNEQMKDAALKAWCARDLHITRAVEAEREECAKVANKLWPDINGSPLVSTEVWVVQRMQKDIAAAIRERGKG